MQTSLPNLSGVSGLWRLWKNGWDEFRAGVGVSEICEIVDGVVVAVTMDLRGWGRDGGERWGVLRHTPFGCWAGGV